MNSFRIDAGSLTLEIALIDIDSLHLHEETLPEATKELAEWIENDGFVRDPVIVDLDTYVVLDGMHRVTAAKVLSCFWIPACFVDYDSPAIRIETWYRGFKGLSTVVLRDLIERCGYALSPAEIGRAEDQIEQEKAIGFIANPETCFIIRDGNLDVHQSHHAISAIEEEARRWGLIVRYETGGDARAKLLAGSLDALLGPRRISKEDVRRYGSTGRPFPHKATRHMIPARPLRIDVPLEILRDRDGNLRELNNKLMSDLHAKNLKRIPPGALIKDRRYEEEIFIFQQRGN